MPYAGPFGSYRCLVSALLPPQQRVEGGWKVNFPTPVGIHRIEGGF